ncbi:MAG: ABC transporter substrate-binding protein [Proteobacteria bacterium]|nr:ABC transporter substrate-binding protein [Pseudomonadota bacterium]
MPRVMKYLFRFGALKAFLPALLIAGLCISPVAAAPSDSPDWTWSKKNPKPDWWIWGKEYDKSQPVRGGYIRSASTRYIGLMNPNHWPVNDWVAMTYIYEMMIYNDGNLRSTVPWLAESWEFTSPKTVTMKLRKGVTFHDGSKFTAEGLKYQIDWIKNPKNGCWSRAWIAPVTSVEVVDNYTLKWTFNKAWPGFIGIMANVPGYAISHKALKADTAITQSAKLVKKVAASKKKLAKLKKKAEKAGAKGGKAVGKVRKETKNLAKLEKQLAEAKAEAEGAVPLDKWAVGTGKYMVEEAKPGNYLKLKRNPNWWFGKSIGRPEMPYLDGTKITVIPDPSVQLANFRAGKLDSIGISPPQHAMIKRDPRINIYVYPDNHVFAMRFNTVEGPCKDIKVRKAISHAIDRRALLMGAMFGFGKVASCMYPDIHWAHNPDLEPVKYDPELSKKLLAEAGYANGLTIKGHMSNAYQTYRTIGSGIKNMLAKVGVDWQYDTLDAVAIDDRTKNREYDFIQGGYSYILDPDLMATAVYHTDGNFNQGRSNNQKAIALIERARGEIDPDKRQKLYFEVEEALYNNYEDAWIYWPKTITAYQKTVRGWNNDLYIAGKEGFWFSHPRWFKNGRP